MALESKSLVSPHVITESRSVDARSMGEARSRVGDRSSLLETALVFTLIMIAVWTPQGRFTNAVNVAAAIAVVAVSLRGRYTAREIGLERPTSGAFVVFLAGALIALVVAAAGVFTRSLGPPQLFPWHKAWQYAIWALVQEFILQSVFYVRLESVFGSRRAVLFAALLFSLAHIPSPLLTVLSFLGGLVFCELFRRYRNIYPLGLIHAALGLTIAASLPDNFLHHMRVGIGYLAYHH
jgi:membrane protease YdiL (CAAX protease family)